MLREEPIPSSDEPLSGDSGILLACQILFYVLLYLNGLWLDSEPVNSGDMQKCHCDSFAE